MILPPLTNEEVRQVFLNALDMLDGFNLLFLQCSPAEANRLIPRVRLQFPERKIEVLELEEPIDKLYPLVANQVDRTSLNILFIRGLEKSLENDIKPGYKGLGDYYNLDTVPPILSHLNQQRENFRDHFGNICFVFVLPKFAIRYFLRRAPDFEDWNSGHFRIEPEPPFHTAKALDHPDLEEGNELFAANRHEEAIAVYDQAAVSFGAWHNRGLCLAELGRYEEAIKSFDRAIAINGNCHESWHYRRLCFAELADNVGAVAGRIVFVHEATVGLKYPHRSFSWGDPQLLRYQVESPVIIDSSVLLEIQKFMGEIEEKDLPSLDFEIREKTND